MKRLLRIAGGPTLAAVATIAIVAYLFAAGASAEGPLPQNTRGHGVGAGISTSNGAGQAALGYNGNTSTIPNPAALYCAKLGYEYEIRESEDGGQYGTCIFPDGSECDEWAFFAGTCGQAYSYCVRMGYDIITKTVGRAGGYSVCVQDGQEIGSIEDLIDLFGSEEIDLPELATPIEELPVTGGAPGDTATTGNWPVPALLTATFLAIVSLAALAYRRR
jgi:putative hemolysin